MSRVLIKILLLVLPAIVIAFLLWELYDNELVMSIQNFQFTNWILFLAVNFLILFLVAVFFVVASALRSARQQKKIFQQENNIDFLSAEVQVLTVDKQYLEQEMASKDRQILQRDMTLSFDSEMLAWANRELVGSKTFQDFILRIRNITQYSHVAFWRFNPKTSDLEPSAYYDFELRHFVQGQQVALEEHVRLLHWFEKGNYLIYNNKTAQIHRSDFGDPFFDSISRNHSFLAMPAHIGEQMVGLLVLSHEDFDFNYDSSKLLQAKFFTQIAVMLINKFDAKELSALQRAERNAVLNLLDQTENPVAKFNFRQPLVINDNIDNKDNIFSKSRIWYSNPVFDALFDVKNKETYQPNEVLENEVFNKLLHNNFESYFDTYLYGGKTFRRRIIADLNAGLFTGVWFYLVDITEVQSLAEQNQNMLNQINSYSEWQKNAQTEILMLSNQLKVARQATLSEMNCSISSQGIIETASGFDELVIGQRFVSLFDTDLNLRKFLKEVELSSKPAVIKVSYHSEPKLLIIKNVFGKLQASLLPVPINGSDFYSRDIFEFLPVGVCIVDSQCKVLYSNKLADNLLETHTNKPLAVLEVIKNKLSQNRSYNNLVKFGGKTLTIKASKSKDSFFLIVEPGGEDKGMAARFYYTLAQKLPIPVAVLQPSNGNIRFANAAFQMRWPDIKTLQLSEDTEAGTYFYINNGSRQKMQIIHTEQGLLILPAND